MRNRGRHAVTEAPEGRRRGHAKVSIRDVAAEAGVSPTTVSHALNEVDTARISEHTRQRVRETADRMGYRASRVARALRTQRTQLVGFLTDHVASSPNAGAMIVGAQQVLSARDMTLLLLNSGGTAEEEDRHGETLAQQQVDGVLIAPMFHRQVRIPASISHLPIVVANGQSGEPRCPSVAPDEELGGFTAVKLLTDAGHRRIGFAQHCDDLPSTHGRLAGYRRALAAAGIEFDPDYVALNETDVLGGYESTHRLLNLAASPTAIFCFNDRTAMGAYRAIGERGLAVARDVSVVGFDNHPSIADGLFPGLTSLELPHLEMGKLAARKLLAILDDSAAAAAMPAVELLPCPPELRDSVGPPAR